jgi:lysylphosphatidylglycerol synthetase-like protein (DUF2156 family)
MNYVLALLGLCLLFVVVRIVAVALAIVWLCFLLYAAITHPRETLAWFIVLGLVALAQAQPLACLVVIGVIGVAAVVAGALGKSRDRRLLLDSDEPPLR